ncbi:hypothetical protein CIPAW_12G003000 [Carya illinoinensis]|uniref:Uncharacterized protein n=1 Tax=Carya illinoinensis TaxID=32201 RepID=A0A8T1NV40_CARIL|nr:hypothetical protein CIPAW_12G003000 [Carya illinoinensis]
MIQCWGKTGHPSQLLMLQIKIHVSHPQIYSSKQPMLRKTGDSSVITLSNKVELQDSNKSVEKHQHARQVSFNDSVKSMEYSTYLDMPKSNEEMSDGKKKYALRSKFEGEKYESSSATLAIVMDGHSSSPAGECIKKSIDTHEGNRTEISHGDELLHSRTSKVILPSDSAASCSCSPLCLHVACLFLTNFC